MRQNIGELYAQVLERHDLDALKPVAADYTGLFLPTIPAENETPRRRVMLVGQETRRWNGKLSHWIEASATGRTVEYIDQALARYLETRHMPPSKHKFLQFMRQSEQALSLPLHTLQWGNLFACAYRRASPKNRPSEELESLLALSYDLLALQIHLLKPDAILFTTGPGYDRFIKQFSVRFGGYSHSVVEIPRQLWKFRLGDIRCFRTTHPRYAAGTATRAKALNAITAL